MVYIGFCGEHFSISLRQMPRSAIAGKYGKLVNVSLDFFFKLPSFFFLILKLFHLFPVEELSSCLFDMFSFFSFFLSFLTQENIPGSSYKSPAPN